MVAGEAMMLTSLAPLPPEEPEVFRNGK